MKKLWLVGVVAMVLIGCGEAQAQQRRPAPPTGPSPVVAENTLERFGHEVIAVPEGTEQINLKLYTGNPYEGGEYLPGLAKIKDADYVVVEFRRPEPIEKVEE